MKKIAIAAMMMLALAGNMRADEWRDGKFSMFIHFGLYSQLGGVWNGQPVTRGYSEQIQSHGGIQSDLYGEIASGFNPEHFDADAIAALAKAAGMKSIVITSKHHDGFCMFRTATTDYNSVDATPAGRDYIGELSDACHRAGLRFGVYFSLIDWHFPYGHPITSHNADPVLPEHHEFSKAQVRELLTQYGPISELWFDMGSLTPQQSRDLYDLVKALQPDCKVSGRLGNDAYDFAVMADNSFPTAALQTDWQSAASIFRKTWGYRSWQVRGNPDDKVAEKLRSLTGVVSHGGNYLLNIGPDGMGDVPQFEQDVLKGMGRWISRNADVIYGCSRTPYLEDYEWGDVTCKGRMLNLILSGKCPEDGVIRVPDPDNWSKTLCFKVSAEDFAVPTDLKVIRHECVKEVGAQPEPALKTRELSLDNATSLYSYSCMDYYTNIPSAIAYRWNVAGKTPKSAEIIFTSSEYGRDIELVINGKAERITLAGDPEAAASCTMSALDTTFRSAELNDYSFSRNVEVPAKGNVLLECGAGNQVDILVDGRRICRHNNPYRQKYTQEQLLVNMEAGTHELTLKTRNRYENEVRVRMAASAEPVYRMTVALPKTEGRSYELVIRAADPASEHSDCLLHNLRIKL